MRAAVRLLHFFVPVTQAEAIEPGSFVVDFMASLAIHNFLIDT